MAGAQLPMKSFLSIQMLLPSKYCTGFHTLLTDVDSMYFIKYIRQKLD